MLEQMDQIDVKKIMEELRAEIKEKGYKAEDLSFQDVASSGHTQECEFDINQLSCGISEAISCQRVDLYCPVTGNAVKRLIKKIIRKVIGVVLVPVTLEQERYNTIMAGNMEQIYAYIYEQENTIEELKLKVSRLEKKLKDK